VGWVLSDFSTPVRLAALHALAAAYAQADFISAMHVFTERFVPRMLEMARRDTEVGVRVAAAGVLGAIDRHGLLDEARRAQLCVLVYDREPKVRRAVSSFVRGVWEETVEERLVGRKANETEKKRAGVKALAELLVSWGRALDREEKGEDEESSTQDHDVEAEGSSQEQGHIQGAKWIKKKEVARLLSAEQRGRTALAVEALYDEIEVVSDWETLLDILLLDHSAVGGGQAAPKGKGRPKQAMGKGSQEYGAEKVVDEAWRLEEIEENVVLEVLVAALRKAKAEGASAAKKVIFIYSLSVYRG
jgi:cohesin complex subunit SA-1/2